MRWHSWLTSSFALWVWQLLLAGARLEAESRRILQVPLNGVWRTFYLEPESDIFVHDAQPGFKRAKRRKCTLEIAVNGYGIGRQYSERNQLASNDDRDRINQYYKNVNSGNFSVDSVLNGGEEEYEGFLRKVEVACQAINPRTGSYTPIRSDHMLPLMNEVYRFPASGCAALRIRTTFLHAEVAARYVCPNVKVRNVLPPLGVLLKSLAKQQLYKPSRPPNIPSTSRVVNMWTIQASNPNCIIYVNFQNFQTGRGGVFETYEGTDIHRFEYSQFRSTLIARDYTGQTFQFVSCSGQVFIASMNSMYSPERFYSTFSNQNELLFPPLPTFQNVTYWEQCHNKDSPALATIRSRCNPTVALDAKMERKSFDFVVQNLDQVQRRTATITRPSAEYEIELSFAALESQMFFGIFMGPDDWWATGQRDARGTWIKGVGPATEDSVIMIDLDQVKIMTNVMLTNPGQVAYKVYYRATKKVVNMSYTGAKSRVVPSKALIAQNESQQYVFVVPQEFSYDALERGIQGLERDPKISAREPIGGMLPMWTSVLQVPVIPANFMCKAVVEFQNLEITYYQNYEYNLPLRHQGRFEPQLLRVTLNTNDSALLQSYTELATNARKCAMPVAGKNLDSSVLNCAALGTKYMSTTHDGSLLISFAARLPTQYLWYAGAAWGSGWNMTYRQICPS